MNLNNMIKVKRRKCLTQECEVKLLIFNRNIKKFSLPESAVGFFFVATGSSPGFKWTQSPASC